MKKKYSYILFDLDGTLTDPKLGITKAIQYSLKHFGIEISNLDILTTFIGPPLLDSFMKYFEFDEPTARLAIEKYREYYKEKGIFENQLYDGILELLEQLARQGKVVILATSKPVVFAQCILNYFCLDTYFKFVSGSELDGSRSKKSEVIRYALEQTNITELSEVVMVGDREHDILGANEIGIDSIGVLFGYGDLNELKNAGATNIVGSVRELMELLLD